MKSKLLKIVVAVLLVALLAVGVAYIIPFFHTITICDLSGDYEYKVCGNHAEIRKYRGNEKDVELPTYFWGRRITSINENAFMKCRTIETVKFSKYIEIVDAYAFFRCEKLEEVITNEKLKKICTDAFSDCYELKTINLMEGLEIIEYMAFSDTENLEDIVIPDTVQYIGSCAFEGSGLKEVHTNNTQMTTGEVPFRDTEWISKQGEFPVMGDGVLIGYNGSDTEIVIPNGIKTVAGCFLDHEEIEKIYIPESVETVTGGTFCGCANVTVYIPESVKEIKVMFPSVIMKPENIEFVTTKGSCAEAFAKENGIKCTIVDEIEYPEE